MRLTDRSSLFGRRDFVRIGSLGALGVTLDKVLRAGPKRDIACILVWQSGGCAHQDTFDLKPDAPREFRGEFNPISTNVPGIRICEHLPLTARQADKFTILRSMRSAESNHERATRYLDISGLTLSVDTDWQRVNDRRFLLKTVDSKLRFLDARAGADGQDEFDQRAYGLLSSPVAKRAFDVESEPVSMRERYGRTPVGQGCLLARRLVEGGARFVTVTKGSLSYDTHSDNFNTLKNVVLPEFDRAFAALLEDLHQRGMLDSTLVIAMGEFGRTPRINHAAGRDHHNRAWSICLAGAGIPGGRVLGETDRTATEVTDLPVEPRDLLYTIYSILGVDPGRESRPAALSAGSGQMIQGLLA